MTGNLRSSSLCRRTFLAGLGATAFGAFLPLLNVSGQEALVPKRLVLFYTPHGTIKKLWTPSGSETAFTLPRLLEPLSRHQKKLVVVSGLNMRDVGVGAPHTKGLPLLWTGSKLLDDGTFQRPDGSGGATYGWNGSASVDQVIARQIGDQTPYRSLEFGVRSGASQPASRMIYGAAKRPLEPSTDPWAQFERLFSVPSDQGLRERQSALSIAQAELDRLRPRISSAERPKLEAHLESLATIARRLRSTQVRCEGPALGDRLDPNTVDNSDAILDRQFELLTAALACDLTRVASVQFTVGDNDNRPYPWLGVTDGHHDLTHAPSTDGDAREKLARIRVWYAEKFAQLLDLLDAIPEGDGKLLDHTMVVWGSELGDGRTHSFASTPFVIAGGASGSYRTGRYLEYGEQLDHNRLLVTMCQVMGLSVQTFGDTDAGKGALPRLFG